MSAKLLAADLARIIDDAAIFAGRDNTLPMINSVQFESSTKHLIAVATDRFTLGSSVADYNDGKGRAFTAMLRLPHALLVSKVAKSTRAAFTDVSMTPTADTVKFVFTSGEELSLPKADALEFPQWRKLFESLGNDDGSTRRFGVDPNYLARFSRVNGSRQMVIKFAGPAKPAFVSIGESFAGLIMPVRLGTEDTDSSSQLPDWMAVAKKPARKSATKESVA